MEFLPNGYGNGFTVSLWRVPPIVQVGLPNPLPTGYALVQATVQNSALVPGGTYWAPQAETSSAGDQATFPWCYSVAQPVGSSGATPTVVSACVTRLLTDSGGQAGQLYFDATPPPWLPTTASTYPNVVVGTAPAGAEISANLAGSTIQANIAPAQIPQPCMGYNDISFYFGSSTQSPFAINFGLNPFRGRHPL